MKNTKKYKPGLIHDIESDPKFQELSEIYQVRVRLAQTIYDKRIALNFSQQELASKAKTTQKTISKIESGEMKIGIDLLQKLARAMDLSIKVGPTSLTDSTVQQENIEKSSYGSQVDAVDMTWVSSGTPSTNRVLKS